jgi:UDP-N-acetylmuramoyl-L-alanyl-D-glutamate--2,6-diaminopimelate ligase
VSLRGGGEALLSAQLTSRPDGLLLELRWAGERTSLASRLLGRHNGENLLVAAGVLSALGIGLAEAAAALAGASNVPGRLERCDDEGDDVVALVDYAHTPDALGRVLETVRALEPRRLICVFGCGGDRDRTKRAPMAAAAARGADEVWLTTDNPRFEDPAAILADVRLGLTSGAALAHEELDRRAAIRAALLGAPEGAIVLVAGKGHESYQLVRGEVLPFDDRIELRAALAERRQRRAS